ncbi:hypothetical protein H8356DRAFT_1416434 [Neocallimastix lanati (nom. inval.)]|nr:hypothetical protein H8356DRAFT_1416434 [Neocallimastix sp. JGI-2020a]
MEDNIEIEISETNRGNEQIIINKKHKFNFSFQRKDKSKIYRCTEYKTLNKCKSLIILNDKKEVLKYESLHNHLKKEIDVSISLAKHKIKEEIKKNSIPMDIKPKHIFNAVSQEMGLICPEYMRDFQFNSRKQGYEVEAKFRRDNSEKVDPSMSVISTGVNIVVVDEVKGKIRTYDIHYGNSSVFSDSNKLTLFITKVFGYRPGNNSSTFNVSTHEGAGTFQALANKELTSPKANWASGL